MLARGGFGPTQWCLSCLPRAPATMGDEDECFDVGAMQAEQSWYRSEARAAFVRWECGQRVRRAVLRKAALVTGPYQVGDREARTGEHRLQWSV